jgi:hypothetical protein
VLSLMRARMSSRCRAWGGLRVGYHIYPCGPRKCDFILRLGFNAGSRSELGFGFRLASVSEVRSKLHLAQHLLSSNIGLANVDALFDLSGISSMSHVLNSYKKKKPMSQQLPHRAQSPQDKKRDDGPEEVRFRFGSSTRLHPTTRKHNEHDMIQRATTPACTIIQYCKPSIRMHNTPNTHTHNKSNTRTHNKRCLNPLSTK